MQPVRLIYDRCRWKTNPDAARREPHRGLGQPSRTYATQLTLLRASISVTRLPLWRRILGEASDETLVAAISFGIPSPKAFLVRHNTAPLRHEPKSLGQLRAKEICSRPGDYPERFNAAVIRPSEHSGSTAGSLIRIQAGWPSLHLSYGRKFRARYSMIDPDVPACCGCRRVTFVTTVGAAGDGLGRSLPPAIASGHFMRPSLSSSPRRCSRTNPVAVGGADTLPAYASKRLKSAGWRWSRAG